MEFVLEAAQGWEGTELRLYRLLGRTAMERHMVQRTASLRVQESRVTLMKIHDISINPYHETKIKYTLDHTSNASLFLLSIHKKRFDRESYHVVFV